MWRLFEMTEGGGQSARSQISWAELVCLQLDLWCARSSVKQASPQRRIEAELQWAALYPSQISQSEHFIHPQGISLCTYWLCQQSDNPVCHVCRSDTDRGVMKCSCQAKNSGWNGANIPIVTSCITNPNTHSSVWTTLIPWTQRLWIVFLWGHFYCNHLWGVCNS